MKKILSLLLATVPISASVPITDNNIHLDGKITPNEWKDAQTFDLHNGGKLMIKKEDQQLWIAMVATKKSWAHVYLSSNDTIHVFHASAALGEARYVKQKDSWKPIQDFQYQLRDRVYNETVAAKQEDHYRQFGWTANNNNMGDGTCLEYRINLSHMKPPVSIACLVLDDPGQPHYFPLTLEDHTLKPRLMQGYTPDSLQFNTTSWRKL